jgi:hypothetical protein
MKCSGGNRIKSVSECQCRATKAGSSMRSRKDRIRLHWILRDPPVMSGSLPCFSHISASRDVDQLRITLLIFLCCSIDTLMPSNLMALAIVWAVRIADFGRGGKQRTKRHQGDLHQLRTSLQQIRYHTVQLSTLRRAGSGRYGRTA